MRNRPGILIVINSLEAGGAEIFAMRLAKYLRDYFRVFVTTVHQERNDIAFRDYFISESGAGFIPQYAGPNRFISSLMWKWNALAFRFGIQGAYNKLDRMLMRRYWRKTIDAHRIVLVNSHFFASDLFTLRNLRSLDSDLKWVVTMHSGYNEATYSNFSEEVREKYFQNAKEVFEHADHLFCVAEENGRLPQKLHSQNIPEKVYLGYESAEKESDFRELNGIPQSAFMVAMIARGVREKGWIQAIEAFRLLRSVRPDSWLVLTCPLTDHIKDLQTTVSDNEHILFTGYISDPSVVMNAADCTILPSYYPESSPYCIIESLGTGTPVIATPIAEIPSMLATENGLAGHLVQLTDSGHADPEQIAQYLKVWASDPDALLSARANARLAFRKFSMEHCGGRYRELFNTLTDGPR